MMALLDKTIASTEASPKPKKTRKASLTEVAEAPTATPDLEANPTPEWMLRVSPYTDQLNWMLLLPFGHLMPPLLLIYQWRTGNFFSLTENVQLVVYSYWRLLISFCILHRFFAHKTFSTSRPVAAILGLIASTSGQRGPLWWGSKHVRHHKFCENEGDPHSEKRTSFWYAFQGWVLLPKERRVDWEWVHKPFKTWEMFLVESISSLIPYLMVYLVYHNLGFKAALFEYWATVNALWATLYFNVALHHDDDDEAPPVNGRYKCRAHNRIPWWYKYSLDLLGEMEHKDHHIYPRKAKHPSFLFVDMSYYLVIRPLELLGLAYDVNTDGRGRNKDL